MIGVSLKQAWEFATFPNPELLLYDAECPHWAERSRKNRSGSRATLLVYGEVAPERSR